MGSLVPAGTCFLLVLFLASLSANARSITADHIKFYVAPIHPKYSYQLHNSVMARLQTKRHIGYRHMHIKAPFGEPIPDGGGLWNTNQFSAALWFHNQIINSPLRVDTVDTADVVYVPLFAQHCRDVPFALPVIQEFVQNATRHLPHLATKPHIIFNGRVEAWTHPCGLPHPNLTLVTIEQDLRSSARTPHAQLYSTPSVTMPYPTGTHPLLGPAPPPPTLSTPTPPPHDSPNPPHPTSNKTLLAVTSFSPRTKLRAALAAHCAARPALCHSIHTHPNQAHTLLESETRIPASAAAHRRAWYCLQPAGDTYTRRALFECLAYGAIPVVFRNFWMKALPFADILPIWEFVLDLSHVTKEFMSWRAGGGDDRSSGIGGSGASTGDHGGRVEAMPAQGGAGHEGGARRGMNVLDHLQRISQRQRLQQYEAVLRYRQLYQYVQDPDHSLVRVEGLWRWEARDDALTMTLKAVVRNLCRRRQLPPARCGSGNW